VKKYVNELEVERRNQGDKKDNYKVRDLFEIPMENIDLGHKGVRYSNDGVQMKWLQR